MLQKGVDGKEHIRVGKLNLVDLAGSERQSKTGSTVCSAYLLSAFSFSCYYQGERFKEATKINLSLSALSNVISSLVSVFRIVSNHAVLYLVRWMVGVLMFLTVTPS